METAFPASLRLTYNSHLNQHSAEMTTHRYATRLLAGAVVALCTAAAFGGFIFGFGADDGRAMALACLLAGIALSLWLWMHYARLEHSRTGLNRLMVPMFCVMAGLALYSNVSYLLWGLGYPMAIRAIESGAMSGNAWLPPLNLLWAALCWLSINRAKS